MLVVGLRHAKDHGLSFGVHSHSEFNKIKRRIVLKSSIFIFALSSLFAGCTSVADHRNAVKDSSEAKLTLGTAQRQINAGMSQAEVAQALGSPNMVTKDREGVETWIYDKFSTDVAYSTSSGGVAGLVIGAGSAGIGSVRQSGGASSRTQRTLTIIIKFKDAVVKEFTYNSTAF